MRKTYTLLIFMALLTAVGIVKVNAQVVDVCAGNDTVELRLGNFQYGLVQWQVSDDNESWMDIDGAINTVYRFLPERPRYYRAKVRFPNCAENDYLSQVSYVQIPPKAKAGIDFDIPAGAVYRLRGNAVDASVGQWNVIEGSGFELQDPSDPNSCFIGEEGTYKLTWTLTNSCGSSTDTVTLNCMKVEYNSNLVVVDETDEILSDSSMLVNGDYVIRFADPIPYIDTTSILIGYRDDSFLRRVVSFEKEGNVYYLKTEQGYLNDIIKSGAFCFNILPSDPGDKSSSIKYLDHYPTRKELAENPFLLRDGNIYVIRSVHDDEADKDEDIEITIEIDDGAIQLGADVDMGLLDHELEGLRYEHTISLTPSFDADIAFDGTGHLSRFYMGFYDAQFEVTRRFHIDDEMTSVGIKKSGKFNKRPKILTGFFVGGVPVIVKLDWPYSLELSLSLDGLEMTSTRTTTFTCAVEYNPALDSFEQILEKSEPVETVEWGDLNGTLEMEFKAGPKFSFIVAGVFGPYVKATGKIAPSLCVSTQPPFDISTRVRLGLDLSLGCKFQLFTELFSAELSWDFHIIDHTESSPKSVLKRGGDNQVYSFGNYLPQPISVDVKGLYGMPMKLANVHFEPQNGGEVSQSIVVTDLNGVASTQWKPGLPYGHDRLKVRVFDCEGNPVDGTPLTFHAYSSATDPCIESTLAVEVYHVNENSVIPLVTGGVPPYMYSLDDESYTIQQPTVVTSPGNNYTFYVRDNVGCEAMTTYNVPFHDCTNTSLRLSANVDGNSINAVAMFGFPPYKYSIDGVNYQLSGSFTQLIDGDYTVYVRDLLGCEDTKQVTINQPGHIYLEISNIENNQGTAFAYPLDYETLHDKGVCWSTHHEPTVNDFTASYGPAIAQYQFEITSFEPNVEYYVRAYAVDASGTSYSREVVAQSQQGITEPYVIATNIDDVTLTSAVGTGSVFWDGGAEVTDRGICWSLNPHPTINDFHASSGEGMGHFSVEITDLTPHATYYARAYAINRIGVAYAGEVDFVAQPGGNLHGPQGAINGKFTIGYEQQVYFSKGNLQYQASTNTWRFAENQWDCVGGSNANISPTNSGWIDLFGWGTSGYNHGAVCYQPWSTSETTGDYYVYGNSSYDLGDQTGKADWGFNSISNGGSVYNTWRTLTLNEWRNLLYFRETSSGIRFAMAKVNNVNGILLLPDDWHSNTYSLNNPNDNYGSFTDNIISASQWSVLEAAGAVFIPAAGRRLDTSVSDIGSYGSYWTSSHYLNDYATDVNFVDSYLGPTANNSHNNPRCTGCSVRLVSEGVSGPSVQLPEVTTMAVTETTSSSATCGGIVVSDGGLTVMERGVCWSTSHNPTTTGSHASAGAGTGSFTYTISGLEANTTYYVRAYATNGVGTAYSTEVGFTTLSGGGEVPEGAINGLFSVAPGYQVYFSQGNLQFQPSSNTWRFATNQYDVIHTADDMTEYHDLGEWGGYYYCDVSNEYAESYSGWIDMFGWGTSGNNHGAVCYQPWSTSENDGDYIPYGNLGINLNEQTGQADWGCNAISNGGNVQNYWRTLTALEWKYLLETRVTSSNIRFVLAQVNQMNGLILLPDDWNNSYYALNYPNQSDVSYSDNTITAMQWEVLEQHGAVFLPAAGGRYGTSVLNIENAGGYWSASHDYVFDSYCYSYNLTWADAEQGPSFVGLEGNDYSAGLSVRLVNSQLPSPQSVGLPQVITSDVSMYTPSTAFLEGEVVSEGGVKVTEFGVCWGTSHNPTVNDSHAIGGNVIDAFKIRAFELTPATTYYVRSYATNAVGTAYGNEVSFTTVSEGGDGQSWVDLGMPSGTMWATCNVGANTPEGYGDYYAWGEIMPKEFYDWNNYLYGYYNNFDFWVTKYCNLSDYGYNGYTDDLTVLQAEDDAAAMNWGIGWAIPTVEQWQELQDNTTSTWTSQNGMSGWLFTASNGNSIFLPSGRQYMHGFSGGENQGCYWSSSLYCDSPFSAWAINFNFGNDFDFFQIVPFRRDYGLTIRPVRSNSGSSSQLPQVTTSEVTEYYNNMAICRGNVLSDGGSTVTERGVCWSTSPNPTINGDHASSGSGVGAFIVYTTEIAEGITYYARAYAINAVGIAYGNEVSFMKHQGGGGGGGTGGECPEGGINALFTINEDDDLVYFSQGNLQYQASTSTWRFAENQWDYVGDANNNISPTYDGWIDLFGWGTSGYNHGAVCYQPWSTSQNPNDYSAYDNWGYNLYDQTGQADWGYNAISNGGNTENSGWRTLNREEWTYVFDGRNTVSGVRFAKATVAGIKGVVLLPDNWQSSIFALNNVNQKEIGYQTNTISISEWSILEANGAVFFPVTGGRDGSELIDESEIGPFGAYWGSSLDVSGIPRSLLFSDDTLEPDWDLERSCGIAVRLVYGAGSGSGSGGGGGGPHK